MADDNPTSWGATPIEAGPAAWGAVPVESERSITKTGVLAPFGTYPETYRKMQKESGEQVERGIKQLSEGDPSAPSWYSPSSLWERTKGAGNVAFGALGGLGGNTLNAAARTFVGQPVENLTGIPKEYTEFTAGLATPGIGMTRLPRLPAYVPKTAPKPLPAGRLSDEAAERAAQAEEFGFKLSRGQAESDLEAIRREDMAARGAYGKPAQDTAAPFFERQFEDIQRGGRDVGERLARGAQTADSPGAAGATISGEVGDEAARARAAVEAAEASAAREAEAQRARLANQQRALTESIEGGHAPIAAPREAGEVVGQAVRERAAAARSGFQREYDEAFGLPGQFHAGALEGIGNRIQGRLTLGDNPVIIDDVTTPIASRAVRDLDNVSHLRIQNRADPFGAPNPDNIVAVDLRGVDQARKRLVAYYKAARSSGNAADARAAGRIIDEFDSQIERAISNGLFTGDPRALEALQRARASYSNYARTYRPQGAGDDVGQAMRRIIERNATPEEIANMVIGSGRLGSAGLPVRLADRLETVLGRDSEAWSSIRQALWQRASNPVTITGAVTDAARISRGIDDFARSSLARRVFDPAELAAMRSHARGMRDLEQTIAQLPETALAERGRNAYQRIFGGEGIGGAQATTFRRMVDGTATPEEVSNAVFNAIGSGNPGNVARMIGAIERIVGPGSDTMAAIRQGVWQKLTQNAAGKDQPGQQKVAQAINEFLNGKGAGIARQLYSANELAMMRRYADAIKLTVISKYSRTNSDTPVALGAMQRASLAVSNMLVHSVASKLGPLGPLVAGGVKGLLERPFRAAADRRAGRDIGRQFEYRRGGRIKGYADGGDIGPFVPLERAPEVNVGNIGGLSKGSIDAVKGAGRAVYEDLAAPGQAIGDAVSRIGSAASPGFVDFATPVAAAAMNVAPGPRMQRAGLKAAETVAPKLAEWSTPKLEPAGIRAYHGSPHDFDAFDISKIGTGEGAQAYGHGLYFAGNENVARDYRNRLTVGASAMDQTALTYLAKANGDKAEAKRLLQEALGQKLPDTHPAMEAIDRHDTGRMYEVAINADPEHFLHWHKPLNEQSEFVKNAIAKVDASALKPAPKMSEIKDFDIRNIIREALRQNEGNARDLGLIIDNDGRLYSAVVKHAKRRGVDLAENDMRASDYVYDKAGGFLDKLRASQEHTGEALHRVLGSKGSDKMEQAPVAAMLREAGIPGIKYLDQGSRGAGEGSHNYVVFDDKLLSILNKYRKGGTVPYFMRAHGGGVNGYADGGPPEVPDASTQVRSAAKTIGDMLAPSLTDIITHPTARPYVLGPERRSPDAVAGTERQPLYPLGADPRLPAAGLEMVQALPGGGTELAAVPAMALTTRAGKAGRGIVDALSPSVIEATPRVSTRLPSVKSGENPLAENRLTVDLEAMRKTPTVFEHNVGLARDYPNVPGAWKRLPPEELAQRYMQMQKDNLLYLHDTMPHDMRARSSKWYEGANKIVNDISGYYGTDPRSTAAAIAALSPQKDWFMNANLAERVHDIHLGRKGTQFSPQMAETAQRIFSDPKFGPALKRIQGSRYGDLSDPVDQAIWMRLYDEAHHPRGYRMISPEGHFLGPATTNAGAEAKVGWGSTAEIAKAIQALEAKGDLTKISPLLGERHKVRNFYNNMIDPFSRAGDVTIDTHAVAAANMRPLSGNSLEVAQNFGNYPGAGLPAAKGSDVTGVRGTYALGADAYRAAAAERGILPREMQSITWEGVRGLFPSTFKAQPKNVKAIDSIWQKYREGVISFDEARRQTVNTAGGIRAPDWYQ